MCKTIRDFFLSVTGMTWVSTDTEKEMLLLVRLLERATKTPLDAK